jgi:hypothetical protein
MLYGYEGTIHHTEHLDVEVDKEGNVVSVWFRCCALPFVVTSVGKERTAEMKSMYDRVRKAKITAIDIDFPSEN